MKKSNLIHSEAQLKKWAEDENLVNVPVPDFYPIVAVGGRTLEKGEIVERVIFVYAEDFGKPAHEAVVKAFKVKVATAPNAEKAHNKDKDVIRAIDAKEKEENV